MSALTEQQQRAVTSIDDHVLVSAGAGSGKTHVLVERFLHILDKCRDARVSELIAVTYTTKAAREMRSRLKARMDELVQAAQDPQAKARWLECRSEVDASRIGTIHALCESILRAFPAEAKVDPQFEIMDPLESAELLSASIDQALIEIAAQQAPERALLVAYPVEDLRAWVGAILNNVLKFKEAVASLPGLSDEDLNAHTSALLVSLQEKAVKQIVENPQWHLALNALAGQVLGEGNKMEPVRAQVVSSGAEVMRLVAGKGPWPLPEILERLEQIASVNLSVGEKNDATKAVKEEIKVLRELIRAYAGALPHSPLNSPEALAHTRHLIFLSERALRLYAGSKRAAQRLDFNDLIACAYDLLSAPGSSARKQLAAQTRAILVDEFQDTNCMQSELIAMLAGPKTRLFLIGDDKQSIYKFQGADVSTFNFWKDRFAGGNDQRTTGLAKLNGNRRIEKLTESFRSHPSIVAFVNAVFQCLFDRADENFKARHQALRPARTPACQETRVELLLYSRLDGDEQSGASDYKMLEADAVAGWIKEKLAAGATVVDRTGESRPIRYGDFAVLVQQNADLTAIEQALARAYIPYVALGGASFLERQEVYDIENLLRFLSAPQDSHSLLGVLRSPIFGLSDDLIQELAFEGRRSLWEIIQEKQDSRGDNGSAGADDELASIRRAASLLGYLRGVADRMPLPELVLEIIACTEYDIISSALPDGRQRARNLWKLVELAEEYATMSPGQFAHCLQEMRKLKVKQSASPLDSGDSVKLMTIHGSKGLEFPAVILPALSAQAHRLKGKVQFHRQYGLAVDTTRDRLSDKQPLFAIAKLWETEMTVAEKKRLLYVAMTRARDHLCFLIDSDAKDVPSFRTWLKGLLDLSPPSAGSELRTFGEASYLVTSTSSKASSVVPDREEGKTAWQCRFDLSLLEPLPLPAVQPASHWLERLRVTLPAKPKRPVEAVLGTYFHGLMERFALSLAPLADSVLYEVAESEAVGAVHPPVVDVLVAEGRRLLEIFYSSSLYALMRESVKRYHEPPYVIFTDDREALWRRPDLLLLDATGRWHVIDYKTDEFPFDGIDKQAREHEQQLLRYVHDLKALLGIYPSAAIYFARHGVLYEVAAKGCHR